MASAAIVGARIIPRLFSLRHMVPSACPFLPSGRRCITAGSPVLRVLTRLQHGVGPTPKAPRLTLLERFKLTYKQYGRVLLVIHLTTSAGWFGSFYLLAKSGIDFPGLLSRIGLSNEKLQRAFKSSAGTLAVAYLLYKLTSPLRYAVSIGGTALYVRTMRQLGYMSNPVQSAMVAASVTKAANQPSKPTVSSSSTSNPTSSQSNESKQHS